MPSDFPSAEYFATVERERLVRDAAFLPGVRESIAGFEVVPMNLRHYLTLRAVRNPVMLGRGEVTLEHLAQFIWFLSVDYKPSTKAQVRWFKRSGLIPPRMPRVKCSLTMARWKLQMTAVANLQTQAVIDCRKYIEETMQDRPPSRVGAFGASKSYYSDACFWCATMGREFSGMTVDRVMELPLKVLFQFLNEIKEFNGKQGAIRNPSDDVIAQWQAEHQPKRN